MLDAIVAAFDGAREGVLDSFAWATDRDFYWYHATDFIRNGGVEIRVAIRAAASVLKPLSYLEVGTRYGWSAAQAVSQMPHSGVATLVDLWEPEYAGYPNYGPDHARIEILNMSGVSSDLNPSSPAINIISGDSHQVLRELAFSDVNLATIDGDHTAVGTWFDIVDIMPMIAVGGAVIMDDLFDTAHERQKGIFLAQDGSRPAYPLGEDYSLLKLWRKLPEIYPNFAFMDNADKGEFPFGVAPVGVAVRVK